MGVAITMQPRLAALKALGGKCDLAERRHDSGAGKRISACRAG
jgi:hypothetical protein